MKKFFTVLLSVILVLAFASTGVFADTSWPSYNAGRGVCNFSDTGFELIPSDNLAWVSFLQCNTASGTVSFEYSSASSSAQPLLGVGSNTYQLLSVDNLSSGLYLQNNVLWASAGVTSGSFDFSVSPTSNPAYTNTIIFNSPNDSRQIACVFEFDSFVFNGDTVISGIVGETFDFSIPAGYAVVIEGPFDIVEQSFYINNSWNFVSSDSHRVNGALGRVLGSSSIRDGFSPDRLRPRDDFIQWEAVNPNIWGTASQYEFFDSTIVSVGVGECFVISYPKLYGYGSVQSNITHENAVDMVCGMYITYSSRPSFRWVAIESLSDVSSTGTYSTYSVFRPDVADSEGEVTSGGSGGVVITPEDNLPSGGGNAGQPPVDEDSSLLGTISKFVNDIKNLLSSAVEAINTLVSQGGQFMQNIGAMFTWLPAPLLTVIVGAFTVLLVVGVLKVLWR